jgi:hypothetical protein
MDIQFSPRGTASTVSGGTVSPIATSAFLVVGSVDDKAVVGANATHLGWVEVNALGKVRLY